MRHFVTENVEIKEFFSQKSREEPRKHQADPHREADKFLCPVKVLQEVRVTDSLEKRQYRDEAQRHDEEGRTPTQNPAGPGEVEVVEAKILGSSCDGGMGCHSRAPSGAHILHVLNLAVHSLQGDAKPALFRPGSPTIGARGFEIETLACHEFF